jgi:cytochrome b involved in lipid metabolism
MFNSLNIGRRYGCLSVSLAYLTVGRAADVNTQSECDSSSHETTTIKKFTMQEVKTSPKKLVSFNKSVYDITKFASIHPGGDEIHRGFNGSLDRYFKLFPHHLSKQVLGILEEYKVGELYLQEDLRKIAAIPHYENDPKKFSVEFEIDTRNEGAAAAVEGEGINNQDNAKHLTIITKSISMKELKENYRPHSLIIGIACGLGPWRERWEEELADKGGMKQYKGVFLGDVIITLLGMGGLKSCEDHLEELLWLLKGINIDKLYVHYHCFDDYIDTIPLRQCLCPSSSSSSSSSSQQRQHQQREDIIKKSLLVYEMNGEELSSDKPSPGGGPLMATTPGTHSAYSCDAKWITKIVVNTRPSMVRYGGKYDK